LRRIANCRLQNAEWGRIEEFQIANCRLQNAEWGRIEEFQISE